jgi:hypothetical protein
MRGQTIILLLIGLLLLVLGSVLLIEGLYVMGSYDGCTRSPGGNMNNCTVNGIFGISAGGPVGNTFVATGVVLFGILLYLGVSLVINAAYSLGRQK